MNNVDSWGNYNQNISNKGAKEIIVNFSKLINLTQLDLNLD